MARTKASKRRDIIAARFNDIFKYSKPSAWRNGIERLKKHKYIHHYLKFHADKETRRNNWINQADRFGDATIVAETSVYDGGKTRGLYSLKAYEAGSYLPFVYPGIDLSFDDHDELCTFLVQCTQQVEWNDEQVDDVIQTLSTKWGLHLVERNGSRVPHWDTLYDNFVEYRMHTGTHMKFWNIYSWTGHMTAHTTTPANASLFMNEPNHYKRFYNRVAKKPQLSVANVMTVVEDGQVRYKVIRKIRRWDEILNYYGSDYNRPYLRLYVDGTFMSKTIQWERFNSLVHDICGQ